MRIIGLLMAFGVLALAVTPCSDGHTRDQDDVSISFSDNDHVEHPEAAGDACTPFCICSCCAAHIQLSYLFDMSLTALAHSTSVITPYFERPLLSGTSTIWQPPRI